YEYLAALKSVNPDRPVDPAVSDLALARTVDRSVAPLGQTTGTAGMTIDIEAEVIGSWRPPTLPGILGANMLKGSAFYLAIEGAVGIIYTGAVFVQTGDLEASVKETAPYFVDRYNSMVDDFAENPEDAGAFAANMVMPHPAMLVATPLYLIGRRY